MSKRAEVLSLVQVPNHRSSHIQPTPNGGGLGIVIGGSIAGIVLILLSDWRPGWVVISLASVLAITGLWDDIQALSSRVRFGVQLVVCVVFILSMAKLPEISLQPVLNIQIAGWFQFGLLLLAGLWWINLFNFMDGIDGIAGVESVFMLLGAAVLVFMGHREALYDPRWILLLCVATATIGFLILNWPPAKIFMGDVGSTWLALMIFMLALLTIQAGWLNYACWLVLSAVFVTDATMTLMIRMVRGDRWHEAHRSHAYQRLSRRWLGDRKAGHRTVILLVLAVNVIWLTPLAVATLLLPAYSWIWLLLAYAPITVCVWRLGAGRPDYA